MSDWPNKHTTNQTTAVWDCAGVPAASAGDEAVPVRVARGAVNAVFEGLRADVDRLTDQRDRAEHELLALKDERLRADIAHNRITAEVRGEVARLTTERDEAREKWGELREVMAQDDARLLSASEKVGEPPFGCDTADHLAECVLEARAERDEWRTGCCDAITDRERMTVERDEALMGLPWIQCGATPALAIPGEGMLDNVPETWCSCGDRIMPGAEGASCATCVAIDGSGQTVREDCAQEALAEAQVCGCGQLIASRLGAELAERTALLARVQPLVEHWAESAQTTDLDEYLDVRNLQADIQRALDGSQG